MGFQVKTVSASYFHWSSIQWVISFLFILRVDLVVLHYISLEITILFNLHTDMMAISPLLVGLPYSPYVHHTVSSLTRSVHVDIYIYMICDYDKLPGSWKIVLLLSSKALWSDLHFFWRLEHCSVGMGGAWFHQILEKHGEVFKCCCSDNISIFSYFAKYFEEMAAFGWHSFVCQSNSRCLLVLGHLL